MPIDYSRCWYTLTIVTMFSVDENTIVFLGHIIPVTSAYHALLNLPFATQVNENGTSLSLKLIVEQITLKRVKWHVFKLLVLSYFCLTQMNVSNLWIFLLSNILLLPNIHTI